MYSLLVMTLSGSVLTLLLVCLRYTVLRKMPSTVYYYAWLLVLLRFALPLPGLIPTSSEKAEIPAAYSEVNDQETIHKIVTEDVQAFPVTGQDHVTENVSDGSTEPAETQIIHNAVDKEELNVTEAAPETALSIDWKSPMLWLSVWAAGAAISMAVTVLSYFRFSYVLKKNLKEPDSFTKAVYDAVPGVKPDLYFTDSNRPPMMLGILKPKIILPKREYDEELLTNILRHELMHYRRFDMLYKWASAAILSLHWFNPITWFIRRELNRACEMSCDEMLLRSMSKEEKQSYGNTLLLMAASTALPSAVVATTFATEKRNLKERLNQIMNYKKSRTRMLAAFLAVVLLTGCGMAAGPVSGKASEEQTDVQASAEVTEPEVTAPKAEGGVVKVKNVDEFLAAIAPETVIELAEGEYDLSKATGYAGKSKHDYYSWEALGGPEGTAAELIIHDVKNLTIRGAGIGKTTIVAVPRGANVIVFDGCDNLTVSDLTAGHTVGVSDYCSGGVLEMKYCNNVNVSTCGLYGCGTIGVKGLGCEKLNVTNCDIYECSVGAIDANICEEVLVSNCDIHDIGLKGEFGAYCLFNINNGAGFTVYNCKIHDNKSEGLLYATGADNVSFISNEVTKNTFMENAFHFENHGAIVDGCSFEGNNCTDWYRSDLDLKAKDINGNRLDADQFTTMKLRDIKPETVSRESSEPTEPTDPTQKAKDVTPGTEITVMTIDEFLSAIGPDRIIVLDGTNFNLSKAKNYGAGSTKYYEWREKPDGYELVVRDVKNLIIKAKNSDPSKTTLEALPRYANVLGFFNCENVTVEGFTAGHTKEKGTCAGGVIYLENCESIKIEKMRLYGCGDLGVDAFSSTGIDIINTEIYECSSGAAYFLSTRNINFKDCNIHDVPTPALTFTECWEINWNGKKLEGYDLRYDVKSDGTLTPVEFT